MATYLTVKEISKIKMLVINIKYDINIKTSFRYFYFIKTFCCLLMYICTLHPSSIPFGTLVIKEMIFIKNKEPMNNGSTNP